MASDAPILALSISGLSDSGLFPVRLEGEEGISRLYSFQVDFASAQELSPEMAIGRQATVKIPFGKEKRYIQGTIRRFVAMGALADGYGQFSVEIVPWTWWLKRRANSRIFQNKTVPDIIEEVLAQAGEPRDANSYSHDVSVNHQFKPRAYCVQYRETDFDFISRLMEEEGLFYYFVHDEAGVHLRVRDSNTGFHPAVDGAIEFRPLAAGADPQGYVIAACSRERDFRSAKYALASSHYQKPRENFAAEAPTSVQSDADERFALFDYPGGYAKGFVGGSPASDQSGVTHVFDEGGHIAEVRMQEEDAGYDRMLAESNHPAIRAGHSFTLSRHPHASPDDWNIEYGIVSVRHSAVSPGPRSEAGQPASYANTFAAIPNSIAYRPPRVTQKPFIRGPQTALVVGPDGDDIYTDSYGRIRVKFYWDRSDQQDQDRTCWARVAQVWAGKQWGAIFIPRIGQEVLVDFLEGDPDQPIVIGSVYNAEQQPPYALPANQTRSGIKTRSSVNGGAGNYNELRFEDKLGEEELLAHAERNLTTEVEKDESRTVGNDRTTTIQHNDTLTVQNNRSATITGTDSTTVARTRSLSVGQSRSADIATSDSLNVGESIAMTAGAGLTVTAGESVTVTAGEGVTIVAGATIEIVASAALTITAPAVSIEAAAVQIAGVLQATSIVSPTYSPGAGNIL